MIQILPAVALAIVALTAVAVKVASNSQRDAVYGEMSQLIATQAARFDGEAQRAQSLAHGLAAAVEADSEHDRARGAAVTTRFAQRNPDLLGTLGRVRAERVRPRRRLRQPRQARRQRGPLRGLGRAPEGRPERDRVREPRGQAVGPGLLLHAADAHGLRRHARALPRFRRDDDQLRRAGQARRRRRHRPRAARPRRPHQARQGARLRLRVRRRRQRPARLLPRQAGLDRQADAGQARPRRHHRRYEGGPLRPRRDEGPGHRQGRRALLRAGQDRRLELRRRRAEERGAGRA